MPIDELSSFVSQLSAPRTGSGVASMAYGDGVTMFANGPAAAGVIMRGSCVSRAGVAVFEFGVCIKGSGSAFAGVEAGSLCSFSAIVVAKIKISKSDEF